MSLHQTLVFIIDISSTPIVGKHFGWVQLSWVNLIVQMCNAHCASLLFKGAASLTRNPPSNMMIFMLTLMVTAIVMMMLPSGIMMPE